MKIRNILKKILVIAVSFAVIDSSLLGTAMASDASGTDNAGKTAYEEHTPSEKAIKAASEQDFSSNELLVKTDSDIISDDEIVARSGKVYFTEYESEDKAEQAYEYYYDNSEKGDFVAPNTEFKIADDNILKADSEEQPSGPTGNPVAELDRALESINEETGTNIDTGSADEAYKTVALIDTGVSSDCDVTEAVSMIGNDASDDNGHGTQMYTYMKEINPYVHVISIKVMDKNGKGDAAGIYAGIEYAIEKKVDIINLSLYGKNTENNAAIVSALNDAKKAGVTVVGSAGNDGRAVKDYLPGNVESVIVTGSCDETGQKIALSNYGDTVDYNVVSGSTSEAAAKMSGFISLNGEEVISDLLNKELIYTTDYVKEGTEEDVSEEQASEEKTDGDAAEQIIPDNIHNVVDGFKIANDSSQVTLDNGTKVYAYMTYQTSTGDWNSEVDGTGSTIYTTAAVLTSSKNTLTYSYQNSNDWVDHYEITRYNGISHPKNAGSADAAYGPYSTARGEQATDTITFSSKKVVCILIKIYRKTFDAYIYTAKQNADGSFDKFGSYSAGSNVYYDSDEVLGTLGLASAGDSDAEFAFSGYHEIKLYKNEGTTYSSCRHTNMPSSVQDKTASLIANWNGACTVETYDTDASHKMNTDHITADTKWYVWAIRKKPNLTGKVTYGTLTSSYFSADFDDENNYIGSTTSTVTANGSTAKAETYQVFYKPSEDVTITAVPKSSNFYLASYTSTGSPTVTNNTEINNPTESSPLTFKWSKNKITGDIGATVIYALKPTITQNVTGGKISVSYTNTSGIQNKSSKTNSAIRVNYNTAATVTYSPEAGYILKSITVNGKAISTSKYASGYSFSDITSDQTISVVFEPAYTVSTEVYIQDVNGDWKIDSDYCYTKSGIASGGEYYYDNTLSFTTYPTEGFEDAVTSDNSDVEITDRYFKINNTNVTSDLTYKIYLARKKYSVKAELYVMGTSGNYPATATVTPIANTAKMIYYGGTYKIKNVLAASTAAYSKTAYAAYVTCSGATVNGRYISIEKSDIQADITYKVYLAKNAYVQKVFVSYQQADGTWSSYAEGKNESAYYGDSYTWTVPESFDSSVYLKTARTDSLKKTDTNYEHSIEEISGNYYKCSKCGSYIQYEYDEDNGYYWSVYRYVWGALSYKYYDTKEEALENLGKCSVPDPGTITTNEKTGSATVTEKSVASAGNWYVNVYRKQCVVHCIHKTEEGKVIAVEDIDRAYTGGNYSADPYDFDTRYTYKSIESCTDPDSVMDSSTGHITGTMPNGGVEIVYIYKDTGDDAVTDEYIHENKFTIA